MKQSPLPIKKGVGKTTTAINLSAGLALKNFPTLLVDLDMQANTTVSFFIRSGKTCLYTTY
jgi:chromosome partitioning protein